MGGGRSGYISSPLNVSQGIFGLSAISVKKWCSYLLMKFLKVPLYQIYSLRTRGRRYVDISTHNHAICTKQTYSLLFLFTTHYAIALITSAILSAIVARQFSTCSCLPNSYILRRFWDWYTRLGDWFTSENV